MIFLRVFFFLNKGIDHFLTFKQSNICNKLYALANVTSEIPKTRVERSKTGRNLERAISQHWIKDEGS